MSPYTKFNFSANEKLNFEYGDIYMVNILISLKMHIRDFSMAATI